uniref:ATP synthase complex subunit 8 n=1 Tax=Scydosella musawasensis TaxID=1819563 RepID=A0A161G0R3_9COLE|nr:ATP synthase F0 subunit 8 [Scydosella musawasensis]
MPQMMPMNWIIMYMIFILIFLFCNTLNYFLILNKISTLKTNLLNKNINWKW